MNTPAISVVMGVCNGAGHLPETIVSVLAQTEPDWEFILVNDGSTDPAVEALLAEYAQRDARIRLITKAHAGLTRALADGCAAARGEYIARIDVGDAMLPERLARQRAVFEQEPRMAFVSCWTEFCGPRWERIEIKKEQPTGAAGMPILAPLPAAHLLSGPTHHASVMFRRAAYEAAGGYRWQFYYGQDWDLWYRLAEQGWFHVVPQVLQRIRLFPAGISPQARGKQTALGRLAQEAFRARRTGENEAPVLEQAAALRPAPGPVQPPARRSQAAGLYFIGRLLLRNRDRRCRSYFLQSLRTWPLQGRAWAGWLLSALTGNEP